MFSRAYPVSLSSQRKSFCRLRLKSRGKSSPAPPLSFPFFNDDPGDYVLVVQRCRPRTNSSTNLVMLICLMLVIAIYHRCRMESGILLN
ncbi:hypothetical protein CITSP_03073 [Citrobacter sp. T1.2D-1]|nr:hypothetical protein CITSP_03073 [Citrobacter sp. T1.2D-1]